MSEIAEITLRELLNEGFEGFCEDLEDCLYFDGIIWNKKNKTYTFIFGTAYDIDRGFFEFSECELEMDEDLEKRFPSINFDRFASISPYSKEHFLSFPLPVIFASLIDYYGIDRLFTEQLQTFSIRR